MFSLFLFHTKALSHKHSFIIEEDINTVTVSVKHHPRMTIMAAVTRQYGSPYDTKALSDFLFKSQYWLSTPYERNFDPRPITNWASNNYPGKNNIKKYDSMSQITKYSLHPIVCMSFQFFLFCLLGKVLKRERSLEIYARLTIYHIQILIFLKIVAFGFVAAYLAFLVIGTKVRYMSNDYNFISF